MTDRIATISNQTLTTARADFSKEDFDTLVRQKSLVLTHEQAFRCSCVIEVNGNALSSCIDCGGVGYTFGEPDTVYGVIQAIGYNPKRMQYSEVNIGTAMLTIRYDERVGWWDRITVEDGETIFHENVFPVLRTVSGINELSALLTYEPLEIFKVVMFVGENIPQVELIKDSDFTIEGRKLKLSDLIMDQFKNSNEKKKRIGIRYNHKPQYLIMDIQKDIRNTKVIENQIEVRKNLPINCMIKKTHYAIGSKGFGSDATVT